jgi:uncharacterized surface protein with fasciclin (FAS1) repeats
MRRREFLFARNALPTQEIETMTIRKATLATAILLGLALNAGAIENAVAGGDSCARMTAGQGPAGIGTSVAPARQLGMVQPAIYWGQQSPTMVQISTAEADTGAPGDIVEVAVGAGSFETLVTAVKAAGLVETLKGEGPFTVFAPTDEAFAKIPQDKLEALLADKEGLTAVLTYHVVPGKVMAADVVGLDSATTVEGSKITIDASDGVKVDGANVVITDIEASNGVIHVIDAVIMPK